LEKARQLTFVKFIVFTIFFLLLHGISYASVLKKNRALNTERPSKSDSPFTINKNRFLFESSILSLTKNSHSKRTSFLDFSTFRFGLNDDYEAQIIANPVVKFANNGREEQSYGESFLRFKKNIYGNDEGSQALAITGFVRINNSPKNILNSNLRGGLIAPFQFHINKYFDFGGMLQLNYYKKNQNNYFGFINSYYLSANINNKISSYVEFYSLKTNQKLLQNYLDFGVNYLINSDLKIDIGLNKGVSNKAYRINYFLGFAKIW